jgi:WD40 repeat protein
LESAVPEGERKSSMQHNLVLTPDGRLAASSDHEYVVQLWDVASGKVLHTLGDKRPTRSKLLRHFTTGLAFSPCQTLLAVGAPDEIVRVYEVYSGSLVTQLIGHNARVCSVDFHPTQKLIATASFDT